MYINSLAKQKFDISFIVFMHWHEVCFMQRDFKLYFRLLPLSFLFHTMYRHSNREMVVVGVHLQEELWKTRIREGNGQEMCKIWGSHTSAQKVSSLLV
jgi:hypothetical protein